MAVFIGGFHAGYAPSSQTIAQRIATYLEENPDQLPDSVRVYVVPNANPTTEYAPGVRSSRLNANGVDLNRNWDCNWSADATFAGLPIGSGSEPFSEPEAQALKSLVESVAPQAVIVWGHAPEAVWLRRVAVIIRRRCRCRWRWHTAVRRGIHSARLIRIISFPVM